MELLAACIYKKLNVRAATKTFLQVFPSPQNRKTFLCNSEGFLNRKIQLRDAANEALRLRLAINPRSQSHPLPTNRRKTLGLQCQGDKSPSTLGTKLSPE